MSPSSPSSPNRRSRPRASKPIPKTKTCVKRPRSPSPTRRAKTMTCSVPVTNVIDLIPSCPNVCLKSHQANVDLQTEVSALKAKLTEVEATVTPLKDKLNKLENLLNPLLPLSPLLAPSSQIAHTDLLKATNLIDCLSTELALRFKCHRQVIVYNVPDKIPSERAKMAVLQTCGLEEFSCRAKRLRKSSPALCCPLMIEFDAELPAQLVLDRQHLIKAHPKLQNFRISMTQTHLQREAKSITKPNNKFSPDSPCSHTPADKAVLTANSSTSKHPTPVVAARSHTTASNNKMAPPTEAGTSVAHTPGPSTSWNTAALNGLTNKPHGNQVHIAADKVTHKDIPTQDVDLDGAISPSSKNNSHIKPSRNLLGASVPTIYPVRQHNSILGRPRPIYPKADRGLRNKSTGRSSPPVLQATPNRMHAKLFQPAGPAGPTNAYKTRPPQNLWTPVSNPVNTFPLTCPSNPAAPFCFLPSQARPPPTYLGSQFTENTSPQWTMQSPQTAPAMQMLSFALQLLSLLCPQSPLSL